MFQEDCKKGGTVCVFHNLTILCSRRVVKKEEQFEYNNVSENNFNMELLNSRDHSQQTQGTKIINTISN